MTSNDNSALHGYAGSNVMLVLGFFPYPIPDMLLLKGVGMSVFGLEINI